MEPLQHLLARASVAAAVGLATAAGLSAPLPAAAQTPAAAPPHTQREPGPDHHDDPARHPYLGMWVTADGHIRHELLPDGRYDEQRGDRPHAYRGRYWVKGARIAYRDDTGFSADGEFRDGHFFHGGYVFHRAQSRPARSK